MKPAPTPQVRSGLGAFGRTARALVSAVTLPELARGALEELRDALGLEVAALYLPADDGRPALERLEVAGSGREARDRLVFDAEAWRLAVQGDAPLVMHDRGEWLMEHPFSPPAESWLVLPLGDRLGVVIAAPAEVGPESGAVLRLLGDLLGAGIASARLRQELEHTALERERLRLAAEVHDGLAQDLALAMRELALLDSRPAPEVAEASHARLRAAIASAHGTVRSRLARMVAPTALGGLRPALDELCERFAQRGLTVRLDYDAELPEQPPPVVAVAIRVVSEALANAERHAGASAAVVEARRIGGRLELAVQDDGRGFAVTAGPGEGHFGLLLMRERARAAGGSLLVDSGPGRGTRVVLDLPMARS
jgi:nitrate/nitrite-specific signal transduction histidine kinase